MINIQCEPQLLSAKLSHQENVSQHELSRFVFLKAYRKTDSVRIKKKWAINVNVPAIVNGGRFHRNSAQSPHKICSLNFKNQVLTYFTFYSRL
jgi:hypothetical protein